jgi:hypothetical protein
MVLRHYRIDYEKQKEQPRRTEKDLEGTELTLLEASLVGLGGSALWVSGTGGKLLQRTLARLPESAGHACLAGAVAGARFFADTNTYRGSTRARAPRA